MTFRSAIESFLDSMQVDQGCSKHTLAAYGRDLRQLEAHLSGRRNSPQLASISPEMLETFLSLLSSVLAAYAIQRLKFRGSDYVGLAIYAAYLVPPSILFIPLAQVVYQLGLFDTPYALVLTYPTFLVPFCTWLLIGYFKSIPYELEECALIDGATRLQAFTARKAFIEAASAGNPNREPSSPSGPASIPTPLRRTSDFPISS